MDVKLKFELSILEEFNVFFFQFFFQLIKFSIFFKNLSFCNFLNKYNFLFNYFKKNDSLKSNHQSFFFHHRNILIKIKKNKWNFTNSKLFFTQTSDVYSIINSRNTINKNLNFKFFKNFHFIIFMLSFSTLQNRFSYHHNFRLFFINNFKNNLVIVDLQKYVMRWVEAQNFLYNIYYYNFLPILFGSLQSQNEILAVNWFYLKLDLNTWKYIYPFFIFRTNTYGVKIKNFFKKLNLMGENFFLISDVNYHFKTLYYFRRFKFYTLGPVTSNIDPWVLSYPIPVFSISFLVEYYFLKLIIFYEKCAVSVKYNLFKKQWFLFLINKKKLNIM